MTTQMKAAHKAWKTMRANKKKHRMAGLKAWRTMRKNGKCK